MRKTASAQQGMRPGLRAITVAEDDAATSAVFGDRRRWTTADAVTHEVIVHPIRGPLSVDEARSLCLALLESAEFAEHGPGEWRDGAWHPEATQSAGSRAALA